MKRLSFDKSSILLFVIIGLTLGTALFIGFALSADSATASGKDDRIRNVLIILEIEGKPAASELFLFYPATGKGALLDVPGETGLIIKSLNRVDRIDALYDPRRPMRYVDEVASLLAAEIPSWLVLNAAGLAATVDLLEGIELFVSQPIETQGPQAVRLASGARTLDGDKVVQYASYRDPDEGEGDAALRRQRLIQALFRRLGEQQANLARKEVFPAFRRVVRTNMPEEALKKFFLEFARLDVDRLVFQRVTGLYRQVDGKRLLFPHYDGELVRDIMKQTLNALSSAGTAVAADKIVTLEVLNGTASKGLAKRTADIFQSFGYDVIAVGNADREDYAATLVIDRFNNAEAAKSVAEVIRCRNITTRPSGEGESTADFTIILGTDFNGRYCAK